MGPGKHVLNEGARWRHLANAIDPSVSGGNAAFLSKNFDQLILLLLSSSSSASLPVHRVNVSTSVV